MKIHSKLAAFFASLIICASFCAAQQTSPAQPPQSATVVARIRSRSPAPKKLKKPDTGSREIVLRTRIISSD